MTLSNWHPAYPGFELGGEHQEAIPEISQPLHCQKNPQKKLGGLRSS